MRDAGRVGQLPPCRSVPRSCRPPSCRRHSPAVLQGLSVRSLPEATHTHSTQSVQCPPSWNGQCQGTWPGSRLHTPHHPAGRQPGGRRAWRTARTRPSTALRLVTARRCSLSVRDCLSTPLLLCRLSPLRYPGPAPFALCLGHSPGAADPSHPAGCDPASALIRRRLSTRPRVDSRGGEGVRRRRHASRAHDRCWSDVCTLSGSAGPCASGRI